LEWPDADIREQVNSCLAETPGVFLVDACLNALRGGHQLIVKCESEKGITIDELASINRAINRSFALPGLDFETLTVEVTSPGTGYPVKDARHFRRFIGLQMKIRHSVSERPNPLVGEIKAVAEDQLAILVDDEVVQLPLDRVIDGKAKLQW